MRRSRGDDSLALARLLRQGVPVKTIARQMGLPIKEVEASRNALPLEEPQPGGYSIPGETEPQKWSTTMIKQDLKLSRISFHPETDISHSVRVGFGNDCPHLDKLSPGKHIMFTGVERTQAGIQFSLAPWPQPKKGDKSTKVQNTGQSRERRSSVTKCLPSSLAGDVPAFFSAPASVDWSEARQEWVFTVSAEDLEDVLQRQKVQAEKKAAKAAPAPGGATVEQARPEEGEPEACFRAAVDAIFKAGQKLNRRHFFLSEDGVTRVWVDGSTLGYEQLADLNEVLPSKAVTRWLKVQPDGRDLALDFLDIERDLTRRELRAWLIDRDREDLAASLPKEFK